MFLLAMHRMVRNLETVVIDDLKDVDMINKLKLAKINLGREALVPEPIEMEEGSGNRCVSFISVPKSRPEKTSPQKMPSRVSNEARTPQKEAQQTQQSTSKLKSLLLSELCLNSWMACYDLKMTFSDLAKGDVKAGLYLSLLITVSYQGYAIVRSSKI
eukprot:scaffold96966_cov57-Attheya_sp.AAC.1